MLIPTVIVVLVAVALGVAGLLLGGSGAGKLFDDVRDALGGGGTGSSRCTIAAAESFDPPDAGRRRQRERRALRPCAIDGDPSTAWNTEGYNDRDITKLKHGVGLVLAARLRHRPAARSSSTAPRTTGRPRSTSPRAPQDSLDGWGEPVDDDRRPSSRHATRSTSTAHRGGGRAHLDPRPRRRAGTGRRGDRRGPASAAAERPALASPHRSRVDDEALVRAAQAGDRDALDALLRRHHDRILRGVPPPGRQRGRRARRHPGGADRHRPRDPPLRRTGRVLHLGLPGGHQRLPRRAPAPTTPAHPRACPEELGAAIGAQAASAPATGIEVLPDRLADRRRARPSSRRSSGPPVVLRDLCDLDYAEIAEALGIPPGTVRSRIARGRAQLARLLEAGEPGRPPPGRPSPRHRNHTMTDDALDPLDELASAHLDGATTPDEAARGRGRPALPARVEALRCGARRRRAAGGPGRRGPPGRRHRRRAGGLRRRRTRAVVVTSLAAGIAPPARGGSRSSGSPRPPCSPPC